MITQENKKHLLALREQIENCLFEKLSDDEEAIKVAKDILNSASLILEKAKNKEDLIGIYATICTRLTYLGYNYILFYEIDLSNTFHKISLYLYECIDMCLSNSITENKLAKSIWPYDINDIDSVKHALSEYIFNNVFIFGPGYIFAHDFISKYEEKIKEAKTPREVMRVYNKIRTDAWLHSWKCREEGEHHEGLKYDILSEILRFMISDFRDLLSSESQVV
jgi:hypothetical protein